MATGNRNFLERYLLIGAKFDEKTNYLLYYEPIKCRRRTFFRTPTRIGLPTVIGLSFTDIL